MECEQRSIRLLTAITNSLFLPNDIHLLSVAPMFTVYRTRQTVLYDVLNGS